MQVMRRSIVALGMAAILALTGCGGLGVNIGSGTSRGSQVVNKVGISVQSGVNIYNVSRNAFLLLVSTAYYQYGSNMYVSATQGAVWNVIESSALLGPTCPGSVGTANIFYPCSTSSSFTGIILLFNGDCATPYRGQATQNICVFGFNVGAAGPTTAGIQATVAGVSSSVITINVQ